MEKKNSANCFIYISLLALAYAISNILIGLRLATIPRFLMGLGFPYNTVAQLPEFVKPVSVVSIGFIVLAVLFIVEAILSLSKRRIYPVFLFINSILQVIYIGFLAFFYISRAIPFASEIMVMFGMMQAPWFLTPWIIICISEAYLLIPEFFLILCLLNKCGRTFSKE
ncbi:hypothetical protein KAH81_03365 [bacterium]|nr:hypothetical protein [bacterium]